MRDDEALEELASDVFNFQNEESNAVENVQKQYDEVSRKLRNLAEAIANGIYSSETKKLLDELETQKSNLEMELFEVQIKNPVLSKEQIMYGFYNLCKLDLSTKKGKQKLIDSFVNSIYLYDDNFVITFNYKGKAKTVTFDQLNSSSLTSKGSPEAVTIEPKISIETAFSFAGFEYLFIGAYPAIMVETPKQDYCEGYKSARHNYFLLKR